MKKSTLLLLCFSASHILWMNTAFSKNLILNPGFENSDKSMPHWVTTGPVPTMQPLVSIDPVIHFEGAYALKMESSNVNGQGRVYQMVPVAGGNTYTFQARFKTKDVSSIDKSVMIRIKWLKGQDNLGYHYIYDLKNESLPGWLQASNTIKALPEATSAEISLVFRWSTGIVWWDDISLVESPAIPPRYVKVSTVYCRPPGPTVKHNIDLMSTLLDKAGKEGSQIICLPEGWATSNTGIGMQKNEANTIEGSASQMMADKAKKYGMYIVSGLYSWIGDTLNNIALLYNRQGDIQSIYKKVQLPDSEAESGAVPGNSLPVFTTDFGKIGILICWDYAFPEVSRAMALQGAELLLCPIAGDIRGDDTWKVIARSRAIDNGVYFVTAIYDGHSVIINPAGEVLKESGIQNTLLTQTIDLNFNPAWDWIGNAGRGEWKGVWRKDRRTDLYDMIGKASSSAK